MSPAHMGLELRPTPRPYSIETSMRRAYLRTILHDLADRFVEHLPDQTIDEFMTRGARFGLEIKDIP